MADKTVPRFTNKIIAFVDILGFSQRVERATDEELPELLELMSLLGKPLDVSRFAYGPTTCPCSSHDDKLLNFRVTQVSDCVIVSAERSPAGVINLIAYCYGIATRMLQRGYLCRGSIVIGPIFHEGISIVGEGYQRAYRSEQEVTAFSDPSLAHTGGGPFIEVAPDVLQYVADDTDDCVREMLRRMTHTDEHATAIYPFYLLAESHFTVVGKDFNPLTWKESVASWRRLWLEMRESLMKQSAVVPPKVAAKYEHVLQGISHITQRADDRLASLNHMILTGRTPREGTTWGTL